jgi:hypothetical protein
MQGAAYYSITLFTPAAICSAVRAWGLCRTLIAWDSMRRTITATPAGCSIAALLLGLGAFESQAGAVSIRVCAEVEGDANVLWDYSPRPDDRDLGEDWGRLDQRLAVPGMLARARHDEQAVLWAPCSTRTS